MPSSPNPPPGGKPHVHHPAPIGTPAPVGQGAPADDQLSPEDFKNPVVADFMVTHLPSGIIYVNGQPEAAPTVQPPEPQPVQAPEQAARQVSDLIYDGLTKAPETFWQAVDKTIALGFLQDGVDYRAVRSIRPFNSGQVCAGGFAVIKAVQTDRKAASMEVDIQALGQDLAAVLRYNRARDVLELAFNVLEANESVKLVRIADTVDHGLTLGASVIKGDGHLSFMLRSALAIRGAPAATALASRAQNARTDGTIRADEQAKMKAAGTLVEPTAQTTTVTTQSAPGATPAKVPFTTPAAKK